MAIRIKTIEYCLPMITTNFNSGTTYTDSADTTIFIPENVSRTFNSVALEVIVHDNHSSISANTSGWGLRGSCNSGTNWTTATISSTYNQTGENIGHMLVADMTAEFTSRFGTGTSGTFRYGIYVNYSATGPTLTNVSAKLYITYSYDDSVTTRIKTVRIPIESFNGRLTNSAQIVRQGTITNQIPALDTFLPEASKVYRQICFELWSNFNPSATTSDTLYLSIDGGVETSFGTVQGANQTPLSIRFFYNVTSSMSTSAPHDLYARHNTSGGSYWQHLGGWLIVTYEYNHTDSTSIMNSLVLVTSNEPNNVKTSANTSTTSVEFFVEETNVTLVQSGVFVCANTGTTSGTFTFSAGSQTGTGYTPTSATGQSGILSFVQRIDSGGFRGAGLTLSRGRNTLNCSFFGSAVDITGAVSCIVFLNYTSDKMTDDSRHNHSIHFGLLPNNRAVAVTLLLTPSITPSIPETNHFITCVGCMVIINGVTGSNINLLADAAYVSGDGRTSGWENMIEFSSISNAERYFFFVAGNITRKFRQYPTYPYNDYMVLTSSRQWRFHLLASGQVGLYLWVTYHSITYTISGTVTGYAGSGTGIPIQIFESSSGRLILTTSTTNGSYSVTWYDNAHAIFATARESSTRMGRSDDGQPT